ncbi:HNH endonuclease [Bacillus haynesii]|uniref:HNH endonuclease n=1 Tax=Bacillus haynesii TaxID=1925021 RepID=UPI00227E8F6F|nr:HNH endonuclease signature motif containing protein [Bacillus haynesii]MCY9263991.1 HNH endonuclease [Bacillus haynesii]MEC1531477.1 HNH endonuclease signature motif containing protein [Bacillus haynesii]
MSKVKHQNISYSSGISIAATAINSFYFHGIDYNAFLSSGFSKLIPLLSKPNEYTVLHHYLRDFSNISEEVDVMYKNIDDLSELFDFIKRVLKEVELSPNLNQPNYDECEDEFHRDCNCYPVLKQWMDYVNENSKLIDESLTHAAFQVVFLDRKFLHDFHYEISKKIKKNAIDMDKDDKINFTQKNGFKRCHFPVWMKKAVFYRDKGCCVSCRRDLTGYFNVSGTYHVDHIIPLKLYGNNDPSNFQILCDTCNTQKGARTTVTNNVSVPFWNLELEEYSKTE